MAGSSAQKFHFWTLTAMVVGAMIGAWIVAAGGMYMLAYSRPSPNASLISMHASTLTRDSPQTAEVVVMSNPVPPVAYGHNLLPRADQAVLFLSKIAALGARTPK